MHRIIDTKCSTFVDDSYFSVKYLNLNFSSTVVFSSLSKAHNLVFLFIQFFSVLSFGYPCRKLKWRFSILMVNIERTKFRNIS